MSERAGINVAVAEQAETPAEARVTDETELVRALMARDGRAAEEAWAHFLPMVSRFLRRYFGPACDGQDLCQEVFLRFFNRIAELRDPAAVRGFLISICLGVARNELRRKRVRRWLGLTTSGDLPEIAVAASDVEAREATHHLYAVLERVSAEDRSLFLTRYVEKMEIMDIAAAHGLSFGTAKRRLARATRRVSAKMRRDPVLADYVTNPSKGGA
jgi:RNA polymerase sigma-70 factor (ECF subfamily)